MKSFTVWSSFWLGIVLSFFIVVEAVVPSHTPTGHNSLSSTDDALTSSSPKQPANRKTPPSGSGNNGSRRRLQNVVRYHMQELDKQTQSDLRVLSYLETELNQIFSCYIRLSCPRMRNAKVLAECDELKDWPLYHQVMKMAGIRRYPYQNYAPQYRPATITTPRPERHHADVPVATTISTEDVHDDQEYYQRDTRSHRRHRLRRNHNKISEHQAHER